MSFINKTPPGCFAFGCTCTIDYEVDIAANQGGYEQRNGVWANPLRPYDASYAVKSESDFIAVRNHFHMMRGSLYSFPLQDPVDYRVEQAQGIVTPVSGTVNQFTLSKRYGDSPYQYDRLIERPQLGFITVYSSSSPLVIGISAGNYSVNYSTGVITLLPTQSKSILTHTVGATHQFTVSPAFSPNVSIGSLVSITGVTGTAAATLNNKRHTVSAVSGGTITLSTVTTGLTASGGFVALYAAPSTLQWSGRFWTPVRYNMKGLSAQVINKKGNGELFLTANTITLTEVRNEIDLV